MQSSELVELVEKIQKLQFESQTIELKTAGFGSLIKLHDTLSSFSNQDDGGIIVFGINEKDNYSIAGVYDIQDLQMQINNQCDEMEPAVRPLITTCEINDKIVVAAEIPGIEIYNRPCYYKGKGKSKGSYIRAGRSNELMTDYEIYSYEAFRQKYQDDIRPVERATWQAIDQDKFEIYRILRKKDKPNLSKLDNEQLNELLSITHNGKLTLASVLLFGLYPQAYFPQLSIIGTVAYGSETGNTSENNEHFLDNKRIDGSIGDMLDGVLQFVKNNTRISTIIDPETGKRKDKTDYPLAAVREVMLNALVHRDYSIHTEGMPIQLTIYNDRLEVKNPGRLCGRLNNNQFEKICPYIRNSVLATAMEAMNLTKNRYTGIPTIRSEMKKAGLPEPRFEDKRGIFTVTLYKNANNVKFDDTTESLLAFCKVPRTRTEISTFLGISSASYALKKYVKPLIESGEIGLTLPDSPSSSRQKYFSK